MREKVGKSRNTVFFQWFGAPEGRKVGSLKRRVRSQLARWEMKSCTPLWREAHFEVKMHKTHHGRTTFGSCDVEKVHAVVARSTFPSQNVQNTPLSDHFWKLRCRKSARRCGAKQFSKSKCTKHTRFGPLLEVQMSKKCTPFVARSTFPSQNVQNTTCSRHFWRFRCRFASLHYTTLHYTTLHNTTTTTTQLHSTTLNYTPLHSTTLNYTPLHYTTLPSTTLHYITLRYATLHYTTTTTTQLHSTTLHYTKFHYTTLHCTTLHSTTLPYTTLHYFHYTSLHGTKLHSTTLQLQLQLRNYTPLHSTTLNYTTLHYITLHYTTFHYTPLHYTTLHYTTLHWMTLHHR